MSAGRGERAHGRDGASAERPRAQDPAGSGASDGSRDPAPAWPLRTLVRALPHALREGYGDAMLEAHASAWAEQRRRGRLAAHLFTFRSALDLLMTVLRERRRARLPGRSSLAAGLGGDARQALRWMRRSPGFTAAAVLVLALGIGVNAAIFTAVRATLLVPPPYPDPDRLVLVGESATPEALAGPELLWSYPKLRLLGGMEDALITPVAGFASRTANLVDGGEPIPARLELVSHAYLPMLGARASSGRLFTAEEDDPASPAAVAVISHGFWMSAFGGDPAVVGRTVGLGTRDLRIVGVSDASFEALTGEVDVWLPLTAGPGMAFSPAMLEQPGLAWFQVVGRLRADAGLEEARSWADAALGRIEAAFPPAAGARDVTASLRPLSEARIRPEARAAVAAMAAAALMVLLIGCANLAGLLLARGTQRRHEIAVRAALGAGRGRVLRQLLAESVGLALLGGAAGMLVAHLGVRLLRSHWPARFASDPSGWLRAVDAEALALDPGVIAFAAALTLFTAVLFGVLPALGLSRAGPADALRAAGRSATSGRARGGLKGREALIAAEVALALMLLVGAGLMGTTMTRLLGVERGFEAKELLIFRYTLPAGDAPAGERHAAFLERLTEDPRVGSAGAACIAPLSGSCMRVLVSAPEGRAPFPEDARPSVGVSSVSERYFEALGTPLLGGRAFTPRDDASSPPVVIINRAAATALFGNEDPLGRTIPVGALLPGERGDPVIVGVVADILQRRLEEGPSPEAYVPLRQSTSRGVTAFVRSAGPASTAIALATEHLHALEPGATLSNVTTGAELLARVTADTRAVLWLLALFAGSAVFLSALGIWFVVAYAVERRRRELGIRMALGARAHQVVALVARGGGAAAAAGVVLGSAGAYLGSRVLASLLFGVTPTDASVYLAAAVIFSAVTVIASGVPALRATRVDPVRAMRVE